MIYLGDQEIEGAGAMLRRFAAVGVHIIFATNNSTTTPADVAAKIQRLTGFATGAADVVTSSIAAASMLAGSVSTALCVGEIGIATALRDVGIAVTDDPGAAEAVVVGLDREVTYAKLRGAVRAVGAGARLVATNTDPTYPTPEGLWPGGGAIVAAIETATRVRAEVAGKPHRPMLEAISALLRPGATAIVGDRPETDLALGLTGGWTRVLALSGVTTDPAEVPEDLRPHLVIESVATLFPRH